MKASKKGQTHRNRGPEVQSTSDSSAFRNHKMFSSPQVYCEITAPVDLEQVPTPSLVGKHRLLFSEFLSHAYGILGSHWLMFPYILF